MGTWIDPETGIPKTDISWDDPNTGDTIFGTEWLNPDTGDTIWQPDIFDCDSLSEAAKKSSSSYLNCIMCRSLESSILNDLNSLRMSTSSIGDNIGNLNNKIMGNTWSDPSTLNTMITSYQNLQGIAIPKFNDPVQETGKAQTSYNDYQSILRGLPDKVTPSVLNRLGLNNISSSSYIPPLFNGKSGGNAAADCAGDLLGSFGCPEFDTIWDLFNILDLFDFGNWIVDIQDAIQGYINIDCNEERGISFQSELDGILNDLPFDTDYNIDPIGIINDLTLPLEAKDNLIATQNGIGDSLKSIKTKFE